MLFEFMVDRVHRMVSVKVIQEEPLVPLLGPWGEGVELDLLVLLKQVPYLRVVLRLVKK